MFKIEFLNVTGLLEKVYMNQDDFVEEKQESWHTLTNLLDKTYKGKGIKGFNTDEVQMLGGLYRRVCSDLSYARSKEYDNEIVRYLNQLARRAYGIIYLSERDKRGKIFQFLGYDFPCLVRDNFKYILGAFGIFLFFALAGYIVDQMDSRYTYMLVPKNFLEIWEKPIEAGNRNLTSFGYMASWYWTHNFKVGLFAFAFGITLGFGTFYMIANNGLIMGALLSLTLRSHYHVRFLSFILSHAFIELMAIFICGGAGFMIARAILAPGELSISRSLNIYGKKAVRLVMGTIPMFLLAGIIEASFSRLDYYFMYKILFGFMTIVIMFIYFNWAGKNNKHRNREV